MEAELRRNGSVHSLADRINDQKERLDRIEDRLGGLLERMERKSDDQWRSVMTSIAEHASATKKQFDEIDERFHVILKSKWTLYGFIGGVVFVVNAAFAIIQFLFNK